MEAILYGFLAETAIHPGSGQDAGFIDLPVAREAATDYPVVMGSSLKGAFRDAVYWREFKAQGGDESAKIKATERADHLFGKQDQGGPILVSDLRLLLLPVRSLTTSYFWITCPHLIERCCRDELRAGGSLAEFSFQPLVDATTASFLSANDSPERLYLEERTFNRVGSLPDRLTSFLSKFIAHSTTVDRLAGQLLVVRDVDFAWFARFGLPVTARNVLDRDKKTSKNLWYEETLPTDSVFYCLLAGREHEQLQMLEDELKSTRYMQVGGNETVGQGWFALQQVTLEGEKNNARTVD